MINSSRILVNIFVRLTLLLAVSLVFTTSAAAQEQSEPTTASIDKNTTTAVTEYKSSLSKLSTLYQNDVQRLDTQNAKLKELYTQGIISRVDLEKSDKELTDARAK